MEFKTQKPTTSNIAGTSYVMFPVCNFRFIGEQIDAMKDGKEYVCEVKESRKKRSLDANAYFWVLADKLAAVLGTTKTDIYMQAIHEIGGVSTTGCFKSEDAGELCRLWSCKGLGWFAEQFTSKLDGCTNITFYKGSSEYDTAQMTRLIDYIVLECQEQGIETMTPAELELLKNAWRVEGGK